MISMNTLDKKNVILYEQHFQKCFVIMIDHRKIISLSGCIRKKWIKEVDKSEWKKNFMLYNYVKMFLAFANMW